MRTTGLRYLVAVMLTGSCLAWTETAVAGCGDVTGDEGVSASDALLVLKSAVGQEVALSCTYEDVRLSYTQSPTYGQTSLIAGFVPDPYEVAVASGGSVDTSYLGNPCSGFASIRPDFRVNYTAGAFPALRFYWSTGSGGDATMIVNGPDGAYSCNQDSFGTDHPSVDFTSPSSGAYDIWIASDSDGESRGGTLYVTENLGNHP